MLKFKCACGATLAIASPEAAERGKCPRCGKPARDTIREAKLKLPDATPSDPAPPRRAMSAEASLPPAARPAAPPERKSTIAPRTEAARPMAAAAPATKHDIPRASPVEVLPALPAIPAPPVPAVYQQPMQTPMQPQTVYVPVYIQAPAPQPQQIIVQMPAQPQVNVHVNNVNTAVAENYGGYRTKRWSRLIAMFLSLWIPGLGQLYKGQFFNAVAWFVIVVAGYIALVIPGVVLHVCCILGAGMGDPYA